MLLVSAITMSSAGLVLSLWFAWWLSGHPLVLVTSIETENHIVVAWWALQSAGEAIVTGSLLFWVIWHPAQQQPSKMGVVRRFALRAVETNFISIVLQVINILIFAAEAQTGFWVSQHAVPRSSWSRKLTLFTLAVHSHCILSPPALHHLAPARASLPCERRGHFRVRGEPVATADPAARVEPEPGHQQGRNPRA